MEISKSTVFNVIDCSINRVEGMIIGEGKNETDAINDFIDKATRVKKLSEENVSILNRLIIEASEYYLTEGSF